MAITITLANDDNHSVSSSKKILSRQGELGEQIVFSVPAAFAATYGLAWIMIQQPDGQLYYIDNGSATGFDHATTDSFTYTIGDRDTMLSAGGALGIQVVLRDAAPPNQTLEWRSRILYLTVEGSIISSLDSAGALIESLNSGSLDKISDIHYDSLADGDLLYRDTTTGQWRNVTLVGGTNISYSFNKTNGTLTLNATGTVSADAPDVSVADPQFTSGNVLDALKEVQGTAVAMAILFGG